MKSILAIIPVSKFSEAKTRLSPSLSPSEREGLLKSMLMDVTNSLRCYVDDIVVISSDFDVLNFAKTLGINVILEEEDVNGLNDALNQVINSFKDNYNKMIITPADIPLISFTNLENLIQDVKKYDILIAPSKGAGTNVLSFKPGSINIKFGEYSFFKHLSEAQNNDLSYKIYESFYLSLDVNTSEDLGEIILHGTDTITKNYLLDLNINVQSIHGHERLKIYR